MDMAEVVAQRSHDAETRVGALLINSESGAILSTGYNGFIKGAPDLLLPNTRPDKYKVILHAEMNLLTNCARHGISTKDCFLISTLSPCILCMRLMINSGITRVIAKTLYRDFDDILMMIDAKVSFVKSEDGFYEITYRTV